MNDKAAEALEASAAAYTTKIPATPGYYVYRLWVGNVCLYVGRTGNSGPRPPQIRLNAHRRTKPWWPEVNRVEVAAFPDLPSIVAEERLQIAVLKPPHNKQYGKCLHDLSLPGAIRANGDCRKCERTPEAIAAQRVRDSKPERKASKRAYDRAHQPLHNAAKRRLRRAPGAGQGSLW